MAINELFYGNHIFLYFCNNKKTSKLKVEQYITQLIQTEGRVVIPGLGTFMSKTSVVNINNTTQTITPPNTDVKFSDLLKSYNKRLSEYISEKENISIEAAETEVTKFVETVNQELKQNKEFTFSGFGKLYFSKNNILAFEYSELESINTDSFGLKEVSIPKNITKEYTPPKTAKEKAKPTVKTKEKSKISDKKESAKPKKSKTFAIFGWVAFIIVILGFITYFASFEFEIGNRLRENVFAFFNKTEVTVNNTEPVNIKKDDIVEEPIYTYHVIAGSFSQKINAEKLASKLKNQGFETEIIEVDDSYKVSFASYPIKKEALDAAEFYQQKNDKQKCWVYTTKR